MEAGRERHLWTVRCEECDVLGWFTMILEARQAQRQHEQANDERHVVTVTRYERRPAKV